MKLWVGRRGAALVGGLLVALATAACSAAPAAPGEPPPAEPPPAEIVHVPEDAETISAAMDLVGPGGLVLVGPGTYPEEVTIDVEDVTLRGTDRNEVIIDGGGVRSFGVFASADGVRIENLTVHSALFYGVLVTGMHDENGPLAHGGPGYTELDPSQFPPVQRFAIDHVSAYNNGLYGIYAFNAQHGTITNSYASGSADSGFYVGQCEQCDILVAGNVAERNAIGFENANASGPLMIAGNRLSGNRIGMTLISNYQEAFTPQRENRVVGNLISNNASADSPAHALGGFGVGLAINGGQGNRIVGNRIEGNPLVGIQLSNAEDLPAIDNQFLGNVIDQNGLDLADTAAARAPSAGNCFEATTGMTAQPPSLLRATCPDGQAGEGSEIDEGSEEERWPEVDVPAGMSFLQVPEPPAQPSLDADELLPDPLPAHVEMPSEDDVPLPDATLLADRSGTA